MMIKFLNDNMYIYVSKARVVEEYTIPNYSHNKFIYAFEKIKLFDSRCEKLNKNFQI